jgi:apolipoprotein N-acyltransferase
MVALDREKPLTIEKVMEYKNDFQTCASQGAKIILGPEKVAYLYDHEVPKCSDVKIEGVLTALGIRSSKAKYPHERTNSIGVDPEPQIYTKRHLVAGWESKESPGSSGKHIEFHGLKIGLAICKDMDFPETGLEYGRSGANMILAPAWDFDEDDWWHSRMAIVRGVESGVSVARCAKHGLMTLSDATGRVVAQRHSNTGVLVGDLPTNRIDTFILTFQIGWELCRS